MTMVNKALMHWAAAAKGGSSRRRIPKPENAAAAGCGRTLPRATRVAHLPALLFRLRGRPQPPEPKLRSPDQPMNEALIACALRTLEAEAGGLAALGAAIGDGLGSAFTSAVAMVGAAK